MRPKPPPPPPPPPVVPPDYHLVSFNHYESFQIVAQLCVKAGLMAQDAVQVGQTPGTSGSGPADTLYTQPFVRNPNWVRTPESTQAIIDLANLAL